MTAEGLRALMEKLDLAEATRTTVDLNAEEVGVVVGLMKDRLRAMALPPDKGIISMSIDRIIDYLASKGGGDPLAIGLLGSIKKELG